METLEDRRLLSLSVGDLVWNDLNSNGIQDVGEPGVAGAVVELFQSTDTTVGNADDVSRGIAITDAAGKYSLGGLTEGANYYLAFRTPAGYTFTTKDVGSNDTVDSDAGSTGVTAIFTAATGANRTDVDAGLVGTAPGFGYAFSTLNGSTGGSDRSIATDADGNMYVAGRCSSTADLDPGPGVCTFAEVGGGGVFLAKYTGSGALQWARKIQNTGDFQGSGIAVGPAGSVYLAGSFQTTLQFGLPADPVVLTSAGGYDAFVAKYDAMGNLAWARSAGGTGNERAQGIAVAADGSVVTTGYFDSAVEFNSGAGVLTCTGLYDVFLWKLNAAGGFAWARGIGGTGYDQGHSVAVDSSGNVYATGYFSNTVDFDPGAGTANLTSAGGNAIFVLKLTSEGNYVWARSAGGTDDDRGYSIVAAADGSVYCTGFFIGTVDFDPGAGTANLTGSGSGSMFVWKLSSAGNLVWARNPSGADYSVGNSIAVGPDGSVYTTGYLQGTADFDPGAGVFSRSAIGNSLHSNILVWGLTSTGDLLSTYCMGAYCNGGGKTVAVGPDGSVYVGTNLDWDYDFNADFDPGPGTYFISGRGFSSYMVLARLLPNRAPTDIAISAASVPQHCRNGTFVGQVSATDPDGNEPFTYELVDSAGGRFMLLGTELRVADGALLDYQQATSHNIKFRVYDYFGGSCIKTLAINVTQEATASVGDRVWNDLNGNGIQDAGEPGIFGATIEVFQSRDGTVGNADDYLLGRTNTDAAGNFTLSGLAAGANYYLVFRAPVGYAFTTRDTGGDDALDSDTNAAGVTAIFTPVAGSARLECDAGLTGATPSFGFALNGAASSGGSGNATVVDAAGYVYVAGSFAGTVDFDPGPGVYNLTSTLYVGWDTAGYYNSAFVAKYTPTGALCWVNAWGTMEARATAIALGPDGSIYLTGYSNTAATGDDIIVMKVDSSGNQAWVRTMGGTSSERGCGIAVANDGSVYTTGYFKDTADFDPGASVYYLTGIGNNDDIFVSKLDAAGNFVWARAMCGGSVAQGAAIALASDGGVLITGQYGGTVDFDPGTGTFSLTAAGTGYSDIFVAKLSSAGNFVWARSMGGSGFDSGCGIAIGSDGSILITGYFQATADFDPGAGTFNLSSAGGNDAFVVKLTSAGNFVWARAVGGAGDDGGNAIAVQSDGSAAISGVFSNTADLDPGAPVAAWTSVGGSDAFVLRLDSAGAFAWACSAGSTGADSAKGIALAADGSVYTAGSLAGTVDFDPRAGVFNIAQASSSDLFLWKLTGVNNAPSNIGLSPASVPERSPTNTIVGQLSASDIDANERFTYELLDSAGGRFALLGSQIIVNDGSLLVYSQATSHAITVRVRDGFGVSCDRTLTIAVTEVLASGSVGNLVWNDLNGNGVCDAGEPGVAGAVVELFRSADTTAGNADDLSVGITTSDAAGKYLFTGLSEGVNYYLVFHAPAGYTFTTKDVGSDDTVDSDVTTTGVTAIFTLSVGAYRTDLDAGLLGTPPNFGFAFQVGGVSVSQYRNSAVVTDTNGNVYLAGYLTSTNDLDPDPGVATLDSGAFIAKYTSAGALYWARHFPGFVTSIAVGADGGVYAAGSFSGTADFDPGPNVYNLSGTGGPFALKLDSAGNFVWAGAASGGSATASNLGIAVTAEGAICIAGSFSGTMDFDPGSGVYSLTAASNSAFVWKLTTSGNFVWAKAASGGTSSARGIALGADGSVYCTGDFTGTTDFDPGTGTYNLSSSGSSDIFIAKLDSSGNFVWARGMGGSGADSGRAIALAPDGSVYATGMFSGRADFDPGAGTNNLVSAGDVDVFVSKLNAAGNLVWARSAGGTNADQGFGIAATTDGVCVAGSFRGTADFDPGSAQFNLTSIGSTDAFVWRLDTTGAFAIACQFGGGSTSGISAEGQSITVDRDGSIITTGYSYSSYSVTIDADPRSGVFNLPAGTFLSRLLPDRAPTDISLSGNFVPGHVRRGAVVGQLSATDPDAGETFSYELLDSAGGRFVLSGSTLLVLNGELLDRDQAASHTVTVRVRDRLGVAYDEILTIQVTATPTASVGDRVWIDANANGLQDSGELGLAGAVVEVFRSADSMVGNTDDRSLGSTITDAAGNYTLSGLVEGVNYYLVFHVPAGYVFTSKDAGADDSLDSDVSATGVTAMFTLAAGAVRADLDAGVTGSSPAFGFAFGVVDASPGDCRATAVDAAGNVYVIGEFTGPADFDPGPGVVRLTPASYPNASVFVAKYTSAGALCWADLFGGGNSRGLGIAVASDGSVYTTGYFSSAVDFDPGPDGFILTSTGGSSDIFVSKLDTNGNLVWVRSFGGSATDVANGIAVASNGDLAITGYFSGTADFDPGPGEFLLSSNTGTSDIFVMRMDSSGNLLWAKGIGGTSSDSGNAIAVASDGSVYTTGTFWGSNTAVDFDPGPGVFNLVATANDIFVLKLDSAGNFVWARRMGGSGSDYGRAIALTPGSEIYVTGDFYGTADFDPGPDMLNLSSGGNSDIFAVKLDSAGNLAWARSFGGTNSDYAYGIAVAADGGVSLTGYCYGTVDFDPGPGGFNLGAASSMSFYVTTLDATGSLARAACMPGTLAAGYALAAAPDGSIYVAGGFINTVDFDPGPGVFNLTNSSSNNHIPFLWKWKSSDRAPTDINLSAPSIPQHSRHGAVVGLLSASDPDPGEIFTYELVDTAGGRFMLTGSLIRVDNGSLLDYGQSTSHNITVRVRDYFGVSYEKMFTITVTTEPSLSMGDRVWLDANANGVQDPGESGLAGAVVEVFQSTDGTIGNADDISLGQTSTDATGKYAFTGLAAGLNYYAIFRAPPGYAFTARDAGGDSALDSDVGATGITDMFTVGAGVSRVDLNAGLVGAAPSFGFAFGAGSSASYSEFGSAVATDMYGNIYVAGYLASTADLDPGPGIANVEYGGFVAKYTASGALYWARHAGSSVGNVGIAPDGSVFATGSLSTAADFDPGPGIYNLSGNGVYVLKLDGMGDFAWARLIDRGSNTLSSGAGIGVTADGAVCITGSFTGTIDFDPGPGVYNLTGYSSGSGSAFVCKLDTAGNLAWARALGGNASSGAAIGLDSVGNTFISGSFSSTVDFDPGPGTFNLTAGGSSDRFLLKLDPGGNFGWARSGYASAGDLAVAADGSLYLGGTFQNTVDFDPGPGTFNLTSVGTSDIYVAKYNAAGNFVWAYGDGGTLAKTWSDMAVGPDGSVYVVGAFQSVTDFGSGSNTVTIVGTAYSTFTLKVSAAGAFGGAASLCNTGYSAYGSGYSYDNKITVSPDGAVCTTGCFQGPTDFDPRAMEYNLTTTGGAYSDVFVSRVLPNHNPTDIGLSNASVPEFGKPGTVVGMFSVADADPNEAFTYELLDSAGGRFSLAGATLRVADGTLLNRAQALSHNVTVRVRDSFGVSYDKVLTITIVSAGTRRSVGDRVWRDLNGNGIQDAGEPGVAGAVVELFGSLNGTVGDGDDVSWNQTVTDVNGNYTLDGLVDGGSYYLVFRPPVGYTFTAQHSGADDALDSDADTVGVTPMFTITHGANRTDLDAGLTGAAPAFGFALRAGGTLGDNASATAMDAQGNVYVTGTFQRTVDFDPGPGVCNLVGTAFIAKYSSGGALYWARGLGGATSISMGTGALPDSAAVAPDGSVYIAGAFYNTVDFDPGPKTCVFASAGASDLFVLKLDSAGNFVWALGMGGTSNDSVGHIAVGSDGSLCIGGTYQGTVDFDPGPGTVTLGSGGSFLAKYTSDRVLSWVTAPNGAPTAIAISADGSVYATGSFIGAASSYDISVSQYDSAGRLLWTGGMGGSSIDNGRAIAAAPDGSIYITGYFAGSADFAPGAGIQNLASAGGYDAFVVKLDSAGNYVWARRMGGTGDDIGYGIAIGADGGIYTTGRFAGTADFDPGTGMFNLVSIGGADVFVSKLDSAGNFIGAARWGGTSDDYGNGIAVGADGAVYSTGYFQGTADFDPGPGTFNLVSAGSSDIFLSKLYMAPPTVSNIVVNNGAAQRSRVTSLTVTFSTVVTLQAGAFEVTRIGGEAVNVTVATSTVGGCTQATLSFSGSSTEFGSLIDGNYRLTIRADKIRDTSYGLLLDGDRDGQPGGDRVFGDGLLDAFFRFFGDSDGDRDVDNLDFARFRGTYNKPSTDLSYVGYFNFDNDSDVDSADLAAFHLRYLSRLSPPAGMANVLMTAPRMATAPMPDAPIDGGVPGTVIRIAVNPTDSTHTDVFLTSSGDLPAYSVASASLEQWVVSGTDANDEVIVDFSHGNPLPTSGLIFDGGNQASGDRLIIRGIAADQSVTLEGSKLKINGADVISATNVEFFGLDLGGTGDDTLPGTSGLLKTGLGTLILSGPVSCAGGVTLLSGTLIVSDTNSQAQLFAGAGLDIQSGKVIFDYAPGASPAATIAALIKSGQIKSTTADSTHSLGLVDDGSQVKVAYTFYGDADLNGAVNSADLAKVLANYNMSGMVWAQGDFDYNGTVNSADLAKVLANYNLSLPAPGITDAPVTSAAPATTTPTPDAPAPLASQADQQPLLASAPAVLESVPTQDTAPPIASLVTFASLQSDTIHQNNAMAEQVSTSPKPAMSLQSASDAVFGSGIVDELVRGGSFDRQHAIFLHRIASLRAAHDAVFGSDTVDELSWDGGINDSEVAIAIAHRRFAGVRQMQGLLPAERLRRVL